jgi:hypothetical protein
MTVYGPRIVTNIAPDAARIPEQVLDRTADPAVEHVSIGTEVTIVTGFWPAEVCERGPAVAMKDARRLLASQKMC